MYAKAIEDCNLLLSLDPDNTGAYYVRGCCYEKMGNLESSIQDFTTVLEIDPNHINAAYAWGACENKRGNFDKAIEDYHFALNKDKEKPSSPMRKFGSPFTSHDHTKSNDIPKFDKIELKSTKESAEDLHTKGYEARRNGDYQTAIKHYTESLKLMPDHFKALFNWGFAFDKLGEYERAIKDYAWAI